MITSIKIQNFALINSLKLELNSGFSIVTGETGSGKSIVLNALNLVLGARLDSQQILEKDKKCIVEVEFKLKEDKRSLFDENELDFDEYSYLRREVLPNGKSRMFVNDTPVTLQKLKIIGSGLIEIYSQHKTYELKNDNFALNIIDQFVGNYNEIKSYENLYLNYVNKKKELVKKQEYTLKSKQEIDFLEFQIKEFNDVDFDEDYEDLERKYERSESSSRVIEELNKAMFYISDGESNVLNSFKIIQNSISNISNLIANGSEIIQRIESSKIDLTDIANELESIANSTEINSQEKQVIEEKLNKYNYLLKKHFVSTQHELETIKTNLIAKTEKISCYDAELIKMEKECVEMKEKVLKLAKKISKNRKKNALILKEEIKKHLLDLSINYSEIEFNFEEKSFDKNGIDHIDCMISVNKGTKLGKIEKTISGGEMSRFMLSVQTVLSEKRQISSLIFDEIDTGVSGFIAEQMAYKMKFISNKIQVISITHLPQVASKGDYHFCVRKKTDNNKTISEVLKLNKEDRITELASLLSGKSITKEALENAKNLLIQQSS